MRLCSYSGRYSHSLPRKIKRWRASRLMTGAWWSDLYQAGTCSSASADGCGYRSRITRRRVGRQVRQTSSSRSRKAPFKMEMSLISGQRLRMSSIEKLVSMGIVLESNEEKDTERQSYLPLIRGSSRQLKTFFYLSFTQHLVINGKKYRVTLKVEPRSK